MAEAEDVITDVARHATVYIRDRWRRHHPQEEPHRLNLDQAAARLDLVVRGIFGRGFRIRTAQAPSRPTLLDRAFGRRTRPWLTQPIPATDGMAIWLPPFSPITADDFSAERYRVMVLQQAMRAVRGSAEQLPARASPLETALYHLIEAQVCDLMLVRKVPGLRNDLQRFRREMLHARPDLNRFPKARRPLEELVRAILASPCDIVAELPYTASPTASLTRARELAERWLATMGIENKGAGQEPLLKDGWTGELRSPTIETPNETAVSSNEELADQPTRSAYLARRPEVRPPRPDEDRKEEQGAWMIAADQPHNHAEDPLGMQRPIDRDEETAAEQFGDLVSELPEARLVSTPSRAPEILLSNDPPPGNARAHSADSAIEQESWRYPEWNYQAQSYSGSARVVEVSASPGSQQWVDDTLQMHSTMLEAIRRRFEMLKAERTRLYRRHDGDELDITAVAESFADFQAGLSRSDRIYQSQRPARRSLAVSLLIDISGSTDGWISTNRRVIDVEREALLLVCIALEALNEPYAVTAFSGKGPELVTVHAIKRFQEPYSNEIALRIAALEPQNFTRAGAAIRHVTSELAGQPAAHHLLLMLSDGKPHDIDQYDGRYGVEDVRQAVVEARLQHIHPFCLTIDRQAADYLPHMFGANRYGLLKEPAALPTLLVEWIRQLLVR